MSYYAYCSKVQPLSLSTVLGTATGCFSFFEISHQMYCHLTNSIGHVCSDSHDITNNTDITDRGRSTNANATMFNFTWNLKQQQSGHEPNILRID